jgi:hypothetical protein
MIASSLWALYVLIVLSSKLKKGKDSVYSGHKKRKGVKVHTCISCEGFPLATQVSTGAEHDMKHFIEVMENIKTKTSRRLRTRPQEVLADVAYDDDIRQHLRSRGIQSNIPIKPQEH